MQAADEGNLEGLGLQIKQVDDPDGLLTQGIPSPTHDLDCFGVTLAGDIEDHQSYLKSQLVMLQIDSLDQTGKIFRTKMVNENLC